MTPHPPIRLTSLLPCLLLAIALSGCVTQLKSVVRPQAGGYAAVPAPSVDTAVQVYRGTRRLSDPLAVQLKKGDEIQTGADTSALLRFADGNEVILGPNTRVRIGSLEVLFGRVFAKVRGLFATASDTVVADVEGTEYFFERSAGQQTRVVVFDGVVRCRSPQQRWTTQRVAAGQRFRLAYDNIRTPRVDTTPDAVRDEILRWVESVRGVAAPGFKLPFQINIGIGIGGGGGGNGGGDTDTPRSGATVPR